MVSVLDRLSLDLDPAQDLWIAVIESGNIVGALGSDAIALEIGDGHVALAPAPALALTTPVVESDTMVVENHESIALVILQVALATARGRESAPIAPALHRSEADDQSATCMGGLSQEVTPPLMHVMTRVPHRFLVVRSDLTPMPCALC